MRRLVRGGGFGSSIIKRGDPDNLIVYILDYCFLIYKNCLYTPVVDTKRTKLETRSVS